MKLPSIIDCAIVLAVATTFVPTAKAKGSSHPKAGGDGGSIVSFEVAPRAKTFWSYRNAVSEDGEILVCPETFSMDDGKCLDKKTSANAWQKLEWVTPPGFVIHGYEYRFVGSGGGRILVVYFTPIKKPEAPAVAAKEDAKIVSPQFTGPVTINAKQVIVQRRK